MRCIPFTCGWMIGCAEVQKDIVYFENKKERTEREQFSDYQNVFERKMEVFSINYPKESPAVFASDDYRQFSRSIKPGWCRMRFSYLRDKNETPEFGKWGEFSTYNADEIVAFADEGNPQYPEIALFYFLQYHLHKQLIEVHEYARNKVASKVIFNRIKSPQCGCLEPQLFNTICRPGTTRWFSVTGQNWGFHVQLGWNGQRWLSVVAQPVSQIQGILWCLSHWSCVGFFRILEIPEQDVWALTGTFNPSCLFSVQDLQSRGLWWDENRYLSLSARTRCSGCF